jgi:hypothetical protein
MPMNHLCHHLRGPLAFFCILIGSLANALESEDISRWVEATPRIQQWMARESNRLQGYRSIPENQASLTDIYEQGIVQLKAAGLYTEFDAMLKAAGYRDSAHWVADSTRIYRSLLAMVSLSTEQLFQREEVALDSMGQPLDNSEADKPLSDSVGMAGDDASEQILSGPKDGFPSGQSPSRSPIGVERASLDLRKELLPEERQAFHRLLRWKEEATGLVIEVPTADILLVRRYRASIYRVLN